jgi:putative transposase
MARAPRLHAPGLYYHVFSRGNYRQPIFTSKSDYQRFQDNLERFHDQFDFKLYAFCLMPNHFHLLIQVQQVPLSKIIQVMLTAYTMYFNKKHDAIGHLFQPIQKYHR